MKNTVKKNAKKARTNKNTNTITNVCRNIEVFPSGTYRVRKMVGGTNYTGNFKSLTAAKKWLKSIS